MRTLARSSLVPSILLLIAVAVPAIGDEPSLAVGSQVVLKSRETPLRVGKDVVPSPERFHVYRVERVQGVWAWLTDQGVCGWVRASDVVRLERAVDHFTRAIRARPDDPWPYQMRGLIYGHLRDFEHAIDDDTEAIKLDPDDPVSYHNRGNARLARHDYDGAIDDYNRATDLDSKDAASYAHRALAWAAKREDDLAIADANQAIRLDPNDLAKYHQRALAWAAKQDDEQALADYAAALEIDPDDALAHNGLAWIWATASDPKVRDGRKAREAALRANALSGGENPYILGTLAAASAEEGDFAAAVRWQNQALDRFAKEHVDMAPHRQRLALYQADRPFRNEPGNR